MASTGKPADASAHMENRNSSIAAKLCLFVNFRQTGSDDVRYEEDDGEDDDDEGASDFVATYFDGEKIGNGDSMAADRYERGDDGFVEAIWAITETI